MKLNNLENILAKYNRNLVIFSNFFLYSFIKIFIGSLNYNTTDEQLKQYYSQWGEVAESIVPKDNRTKLSKGFGFIIYAESKSLDVAMKARPHKLNDRTLEPRRAIRRDEADNPAANASTNKLFYGPLGRDCTRDDIGNYFARHGNFRCFKNLFLRKRL